MTSQSQRLSRCFKKPPIVAYKRPKNLGDILIRAKVVGKRRSVRKKAGWTLCKRLCRLCILFKPTRTHSCRRTGKVWRINHHIDCQTKNVVYKLTCKKCPLWGPYIGKTKRAFCERVQEHRGYISQWATTKNPKIRKHPIGIHFNGPGHSVADLLPIAIEKVFPEDKPNTLTNRESYWINMYDSASFGANTRD